MASINIEDLVMRRRVNFVNRLGAAAKRDNLAAPYCCPCHVLVSLERASAIRGIQGKFTVSRNHQMRFSAGDSGVLGITCTVGVTGRKAEGGAGARRGLP